MNLAQLYAERIEAMRRARHTHFYLHNTDAAHADFWRTALRNQVLTARLTNRLIVCRLRSLH